MFLCVSPWSEVNGSGPNRPLPPGFRDVPGVVVPFDQFFQLLPLSLVRCQKSKGRRFSLPFSFSLTSTVEDQGARRGVRGLYRLGTLGTVMCRGVRLWPGRVDREESRVGTYRGYRGTRRRGLGQGKS